MKRNNQLIFCIKDHFRNSFFCLLFLISQFAHGGDIGVLLQELKKHNDDTASVRIMDAIATSYYYREVFNDSAIIWGQKSLALAKKLNYIAGIAKTNYLLGKFYINVEFYSEALDCFSKSTQAYLKINDNKGVANNCMQIGLYLYMHKNYSEAVSNFNEAINLYNSKTDSAGIATVLYLKGITLLDSGNVEQGINLIRNALAIHQARNNEAGITECQMKIADGLIKLKKYDEAMTILVASEKYFLGQGSFTGVVFVLTSKGKIYFAKGNDREALINFTRADSLARAIHKNWQVIETSKNLADFYFSKKIFDKAYYYLNNHYQLQDSIFKIKNSNAFLSIKERIEDERKQTEIDLLHQKEKVNRVILGALLFFLIIIIIFGWLTYNRFKQKKKDNEKLAHINLELSKAIKDVKQTQEQLIHYEKMASLGRLTAGIAHELMNPLNFVNNFSELSFQELSEYESADDNEKKVIIEDLKSNLDKINQHGKRAEKIIKSMLLHSRTTGTDKTSVSISKLLDEAAELAYNGYRSTNASFYCTVEKQFDDNIPLIVINQQEIARVFLNIINNSLFAIHQQIKTKSDFNPCLVLACRKIENNLSISIKDNGGGISNEVKERIFEPFFTTKPIGEGTGLGLSMSYDIIKTHGGNIEINSAEGKGTEFIITLPIE